MFPVCHGSWDESECRAHFCSSPLPVCSVFPLCLHPRLVSPPASSHSALLSHLSISHLPRLVSGGLAGRAEMSRGCEGGWKVNNRSEEDECRQSWRVFFNDFLLPADLMWRPACAGSHKLKIAHLLRFPSQQPSPFHRVINNNYSSGVAKCSFALRVCVCAPRKRTPEADERAPLQLWLSTCTLRPAALWMPSTN